MAEITLSNKNAKQFRDTFFPFSVGFDDFFDRLNTTAETHRISFPPYNIIRNNGKTYIELALAGYNKERLEIVVEDGVLSISGEKTPDNQDDGSYRGIANRSFIKKFTLGEHVEVNSAEINDGLLTVELQEVLPPEKQPKRIEIR
tara:strand:- start:132 stop:566 length:435 start_codon:yes stop_codon:yes gene_type:complete